MNHFQLIILTASFDLEWPDQVESLYDTTRPIADISSRIISLDCLISGRHIFLTSYRWIFD